MSSMLIGIFRLRIVEGLFTVEDRRTATVALDEHSNPAVFALVEDAIAFAMRSSAPALKWSKRQ